jgi:hypothetical protein
VIAALHAESEKKDIRIKSMQDEMQRIAEKAKQDQLYIINESEKKIQGWCEARAIEYFLSHII